MRSWQFQSNLNRGELSPYLTGRTDANVYYNGAATATNVLPLPQGGMRKRPGFEYKAAIFENADGVIVEGIRLEQFQFNEEQTYIIAIYTLSQNGAWFSIGIQAFDTDGTLVYSGPISSVYQRTAQSIQDSVYLQSADTAFLFHPDYPTLRIRRTNVNSVLSFPNEYLENGNSYWDQIPQWDFNDSSSPTPVPEIQTITFVDASVSDRLKVSLNDFLSEEFSLTGDATENAESIRSALQSLPNTATSGITVTGSGPVATQAFTVTFADASADSWNLIQIVPIYTSNTGFGGSAGRTQAGSGRKEDAWSSTRGYPSCGVFHEGRLWVGGMSGLPTGLFGSRVGEFYDFSEGRQYEGDAISVLLESNSMNGIRNLVSNKRLQVFTAGQEFYHPDSPITPENSYNFAPIDSVGCSHVQPVILDGKTHYVSKSGKQFYQLRVDNQYNPIDNQMASSMAPHLFDSVVQMAVQRGSATSDANYIFILNGTGKITVFNALEREDVLGFVNWETVNNGIKSVASVNNEIWIAVERGSITFLEKLNENCHTDCSHYDGVGGGEQSTQAINLNDSTEIEIIGDGFYMGTALVANSSVTLPRAADVRDVGIPFRPVITTMPLVAQLQNGFNTAKKKRILRSSIDVLDTAGLLVGGKKVLDTTFGSTAFAAPPTRTGHVRTNHQGWSVEAQLTISQYAPYPFHIRSIGVEVKS